MDNKNYLLLARCADGYIQEKVNMVMLLSLSLLRLQKKHTVALSYQVGQLISVEYTRLLV